MTTTPPAGRRVLRVGLPVCACLLLAGCVVDDQQLQARPDISTTSAQPRQATYDCGENGTITVENLRTAVRLVEAEGDSYELPASPPTQTSRYGEGGLALVVEDREALWMKAGKEPMTCRR